MKNQKEWFEEWFDSPYYPILYKHRNDIEAENFLNELITFLNPKKNSTVIDLACGRGRHSLFLNKKGYDVTGVDLSVQSIKYASQFENKNLHFKVADLRYLHSSEKFDIALNLFTSFGYFDCIDTNIKVLKNIYHILKPDGIFVLDFFNLKKTLASLVPYEKKVIDGITFEIKRYLQLGNIIKHILVEHNKKHFTFYEKVQALSKEDFLECFYKSGFTVVNTFGDYKLNSFDEINSERFIMIAKKC